MLKTLVLICAIKFLMGLEVMPERPEVQYYNPKYIKSFRLLIQKRNRNSPYYIHLHIATLVLSGNNVTLKMVVNEYLSGGYQPTAIQAERKLCDFLEKEPFLGKMYAKQMPSNWTCPFPPGVYNVTDAVVHLENFPFDIPFTFSSIVVRTRVDVSGYHTTTKESIFKFRTFTTVKQKAKN